MEQKHGPTAGGSRASVTKCIHYNAAQAGSAGCVLELGRTYLGRTPIVVDWVPSDRCRTLAIQIPRDRHRGARYTHAPLPHPLDMRFPRIRRLGG